MPIAKELPFFKFEPSEWDNGHIQMCSREVKGLFIDLCSLYWSRTGNLYYAFALQKLCNGIEDALQQLIKSRIIRVVDEQIVIEFLDEQLAEFNIISEKRRESAQKRWENANALQNTSKSNARREEKRREEKRREEEKAPLRAVENPFVNDPEKIAWDNWIKYRKEIGKSIKPTTAKMQIQFLGGRAGPEIAAIINQSITNGWTGLFELKKQNNVTRAGNKEATRRADSIRESSNFDDDGLFGNPINR